VTTVPRRDDRKPDSSEPWRYVCPDCRRQVKGSESHRLYRCQDCGQSYAASDLLDLKLDE